MKYFFVFFLLASFSYAQTYISDYDVQTLHNHNVLKSLEGDKLKVVLDLIDDKLQKPADINANSNTITISASELQLRKTDQDNDNTQLSVKRSISPTGLAYLKFDESTLNIDTGAVTGSFTASPISPTVPASSWVWMGMELHPDNEIKVVFGSVSAVKANATYPVWSGEAAIGMIQIQADTPCGGSGDAGWNYKNPLETDIVIFAGAGGGGSGGGLTDMKCLTGSSVDKVLVKKGKIRVNGYNYERTSDFPELTIGAELTDDAINYVFYDVYDNDIEASTVDPYNHNGGYLARYAPICTATASSGAISNVYDYAIRSFDSLINGDEDVCYDISEQSSAMINSNNPYFHNLRAPYNEMFCKQGMIHDVSAGTYTDIACENFLQNKNLTHVTVLSGGLTADERLSLKFCYRTKAIATSRDSWDTCKAGYCWVTNADKPFSSNANFTIDPAFTNELPMPICAVQVNQNGTFSHKNPGEGYQMTFNSVKILSSWTQYLNTSTDSYYVVCGKGSDFGALDTNPVFGDVQMSVFESTGNGTIGGNLYIAGTMYGNANLTETDPIFTASDAFGITSTDITNWDTAYGWGDHSGAGYFKKDGSVIATGDWDLGGFSIENVNNTSIVFADGSKITSAKFDSLGNVNADYLGGKTLLTVESERTGEIGSAIGTHSSNASVHHTRYADSEALSAVSGVGYFKADGSILPTSDWDMGGFSISNVNNTSITFADGSKITSDAFNSSGFVNASYLNNLTDSQFLRADIDQTFSGNMNIGNLTITGSCVGCGGGGNDNYVTLSTNQSISGTKIFLNTVTFDGGTQIENTTGNTTVGGTLDVASTSTFIGTVYFGDNTVNLYQEASNILRTSDSLVVDQKIGIGTLSPDNRLDVIGNSNITGNLTVGGSLIGKITNANNSDYLDTFDSTQFVRSDENDTITGNLYIDGDFEVTGSCTGCGGGTDGAVLQAVNSNMNAVYSLRGQIKSPVCASSTIPIDVSTCGVDVYAIKASSTTSTSIYGTATIGHGMHGRSERNSKAGVYAESFTGIGQTGYGLWAICRNDTDPCWAGYFENGKGIYVEHDAYIQGVLRFSNSNISMWTDKPTDGTSCDTSCGAQSTCLHALYEDNNNKAVCSDTTGTRHCSCIGYK